MDLRSCNRFTKIIYRKQNPLLSHQYTDTIQITQLSTLEHYWIIHHIQKKEIADKDTGPIIHLLRLLSDL